VQKSSVIIIGSGINSLTAAARLSLAGHKVRLLERNDEFGGCIRTGEITKPGFKHDILSGFYPLFMTSPAGAEFRQELYKRGLEFVNTDLPTGVLLPDNRSLILSTNREENIQTFERLHKGDGKAYQAAVEEVEKNADLTFALLGSELWNMKTMKLFAKELWHRKPSGLANYFSNATQSCRSWLETDFNSDLTRALFAPWVLHTGLGPDAALSGFMGKVIAFTLEAAGMPIVKGGSKNIVTSFKQLIEDNGGELLANSEVDEILISGKKATGVKTRDGQTYHAKKGVLCNVTPTQLYGHLLRNTSVPETIKHEATKFKYGRGDMQIHIAMDEPPEWPDKKLKDVAMIHMTSGLEGVAKAVAQAENGLLPDDATIVVAQPMALDPTRGPEGKWILWIQLQELPRKIKGDALGEINVSSDGQWTQEIREAYAQRIIERVAKQIPNLKRSMLAYKAYSPYDLSQLNINLVGGDPYSGACTLDQSFIWRPLKSTKNHATPYKNLFHIGASTHPGPGLGGMSGYLTAGHLL